MAHEFTGFSAYAAASLVKSRDAFRGLRDEDSRDGARATRHLWRSASMCNSDAHSGRGISWDSKSVIRLSKDVLQRCEDTLDVLCIRGNGANARTLLDAGVEKADFVVAATASDETNMLCCLIAKRLGARYTITRIRDPEYNESLSLLQRETSIDNAINPERATALEISRLLRFPFANNIETFAKGADRNGGIPRTGE